MTAPRMATRAHPGPEPAVYHVVVVDGPVFVAACDRNQVLDGEDLALSATSPGLRCYRWACRCRWLAAEEDAARG